MPVAYCGCTSTPRKPNEISPAAEYQDKQYGKGNRVHSGPRIEKGKKTDTYHCTVCGVKRDIKPKALEEEPKKAKKETAKVVAVKAPPKEQTAAKK